MPILQGTRLGPYEVLAPLGAGGMGEVYRARDGRLDREVAVKVIPQHLAGDAEARARFEREAKAVAAISHPNILAIHDVGRTGEVSYAVMELLDGETLRARLSAGPLSWKRAVEIASGIAEGLSAAHGKGIVHRDLKPENLFLTSDGRVKILDFGIARLITALADPAATSAPTTPAGTASGVLLGTVGYMSPEQVRGKPADPRSDLFSLGCVLYEMVTGRRAFSRETSAETMTAILNEDPSPAAVAGLTLPPELDHVIAHCLEKAPEQRFQSARDLAFALRETLRASSQTGKSALRQRTGKRTSRRRKIESLAILPLANASADPDSEYLSDGITESLIHTLSQLPRLRVLARSTVFQYKGKEVDPRHIGREFGIDAVLTGRLAHRGEMLMLSAELVDALDGSRLWGEIYNRKFTDVLAVQNEISTSISENLRLELTGAQKKKLANRPTQSTEAYQLYLKGRFYWNKRVGDALKKAIDYFQQAIERDPGYALAYTGLADCHNIQGFYETEPPLEVFPKAKAAALRALQIDDQLAEAHTSLGYVQHFFDRDWASAEREYRRAIELNPNYASAHQFYGNHLTAMGQTAEGVAGFKRARELDPLSLIISAGVGWALYFARSYDEAIEEIRKALEMDPSFVPGHLFLGWAYEQKRMFAEAIAEFEKAVALSGRGVQMLACLAGAHALAGNESQARGLLKELEESPDLAYRSPYYLAMAHAALGESDKAFEWLDRAYEEGAPQLCLMQVEPNLDALRGDPRFAVLRGRMRFEG